MTDNCNIYWSKINVETSRVAALFCSTEAEQNRIPRKYEAQEQSDVNIQGCV